MESERGDANSTPDDGQRTAEPIPARFRTHSVILACLVAVGCAVSACRPCAAVDDAWSDRLASEFAAIGPGGVADTGLVDHLRLTLSADAFALVVGALAETEVLRPVAANTTFAAERGTEVVVEGEMTGRVAAMRIVPRDDGGRTVALEIDTVVAIHLDAMDRRGSYSTASARAHARAPLAFIDAAGRPELVVDLDAAVVDGVDFDIGAMPDGFADVPPAVVAAVVDEMAAELVMTVIEPVTLLTWPAVHLGPSDLRLTPSSMTLDPDAGTISLGVVTPLRPAGSMVDTPTAEQRPFSYDVHPDLWRASLVYLQAIGRLPRRFTEGGVDALDGAVGVAVDDAVVGAEGAVTLAYSAYCSRGRCRRATGSADGVLEVDGGRMSGTLVARPSEFPAVIEVLAADAGATLSALTSPAAIELSTGGLLTLTPSTMRVSDGVVSVSGDAVFTLRRR